MRRCRVTAGACGDFDLARPPTASIALTTSMPLTTSLRVGRGIGLGWVEGRVGAKVGVRFALLTTTTTTTTTTTATTTSILLYYDTTTRILLYYYDYLAEDHVLAVEVLGLAKGDEKLCSGRRVG